MKFYHINYIIIFLKLKSNLEKIDLNLKKKANKLNKKNYNYKKNKDYQMKKMILWMKIMNMI